MEQNREKNTAVKLTEKGVSLGGKYEVLLCGSLFYFRLPRAVWTDRIAKLKGAGYNCVDVYFPWNYHELEDGTFDFDGEKDVEYFLSELDAAGMYAIARPGPYICSEWNGGAIPARILESGAPIRSADKSFISEVEKWYSAVLPKIARHCYDGKRGSVILLQLENELDFFDCPDPNAYVGELEKLAEKYCPSVPTFCCAGQYDVVRAGGRVKGVEATLNCYPDSTDNTFDGELWGYAKRFLEGGKPLMVSETNRDHFLLRRELSCGSKLLGAYNQVAGANSEYYQAVNNWGSPDAMLATMYDFWSMVDITGNYRPEAKEAVLFSAFMRAMGETLAAALPAEPVIPDKCGFVTTDGGLRVLMLEGGGAAVCVPNFTEKSGSISFTYDRHTVTAEVEGMRAPFFIFDFPLKRFGINGVIESATCELVAANENSLTFAGKGSVTLTINGKTATVKKDGETEGVKVAFVRGDKAIEVAAHALGLGTAPEVKEYVSEKTTEFYSASLPAYSGAAAGKGTTFGALGVADGEIEYSLSLPAGLALFVENPCDVMRVDANGKRGATKYADGRNVIVPPAEGGKYTVAITKWGHSNFDDSQSPAIRLSCKKGARSFGAVVKDEKIGRCDFRLLDSFELDSLELDTTDPVRLSVDKWNSTRKPVVCSYTRPVCRTTDRLMLSVTESVEVAVFVDGKRKGECDFGSFDLTPYLKKGKTQTLTLVYRKLRWTQNCGEARLLHIDTVAPAAVRVLGKKEMLGMGGKNEKLSLPQNIASPASFAIKVPTGKEARVRFVGKNLLLTCTGGGKVLGRAIVGWENAPALHGGDPDEIYSDGSCGTICVYAEPLGEKAHVDHVEILYTR